MSLPGRLTFVLHCHQWQNNKAKEGRPRRPICCIPHQDHTTASCLECERRTPVLIAMAGLPGSGKSTIATCLERELGAVVLNKDRVRAALFPPRVLDYSAVQDDVTMAAIYQAAAAILRALPRPGVISLGRASLHTR